MQFESIATPTLESGINPKPWDGRVPSFLKVAKAGVLSKILQDFTGTPEKVWFCVWEGYGSLARTSKHRVHRPQRSYLLYVGDLAGMVDFRIGEFHRLPPEYWFPDDKSWCVATDIDLYWTYVGGSQSCIEAILRNSELESVPAELGHGLTVDADCVNRLSDEEKSAWGVL